MLNSEDPKAMIKTEYKRGFSCALGMPLYVVINIKTFDRFAFAVVSLQIQEYSH